MNDVGDRGIRSPDQRSPDQKSRDHQDQSEVIRAAVARYEGSLVRYAQHFVGDLETARDVVQDTFMKLCKLDSADLSSCIARWLFRVTRNRAIDVCRKENRMKLAQPESLDERPAVTPPVDYAMEQQEATDSLLAQIRKLPDNHQEVLRLKFHGGLTYAEIADVTGLTPTNVGFILHTAISKLRQRVIQ